MNDIWHKLGMKINAINDDLPEHLNRLKSNVVFKYENRGKIASFVFSVPILKELERLNWFDPSRYC